MSDCFEIEIVEHQGLKFQIKYHYDHDMGRPWDNSDGHGPVRECNARHQTSYDTEKRPGEIPLNDPDRGHYQFYYDWEAAMKSARADGWGLGAEELAKLTHKLGHIPSKGEICVEALKADIKFLRGWLNDDWHYVSVDVTHVEVDEDGDVISEGESDAVCGFESLNNYHKTAGREMMVELAARVLKEKAEKEFWAERDVVTA